jgi:glycosyltransferase involved in cell wall biosynthesis
VDLVHVHSPWTAGVLRLAGGPGRPVVYTEHNVWGAYRPLTRWLNARTWSRAGHPVAVSEEVARSIRAGASRGPVPDVIRNGVDVEGLARVAPSRLAPDPVFGTVANLRPEKGIDVLLDAATIVRATRPDATCVIVGGGPLETTLRARLPEGVMMTGRRVDAASLMRGFTVYVQPARAEGLPLAVLEAMAMGLPIVATSVGGIPEVLADGISGVLVPPGDPAVLAAAVLRILDDVDIATSLGARARTAAAASSIAITARRYVDVYRHVLEVPA